MPLGDAVTILSIKRQRDFWITRRTPGSSYAPVMNTRARDETLFESGGVRFGRFRARPDDEDFETAGRPPNHSFVFPHSAVWIAHSDCEPFVADPTRITLYNPGQSYRRLRLSARGDVAHWFSVAPGVIRAALSEIDPGLASGSDERLFVHRWLPSAPEAFVLQQQLVRAIAAGAHDPIALEEGVIRLLGLALRSAARERVRPVPASAGKRRRDRNLAERARAFLAEFFAERLDLERIARAAGASVYHLCHVFRAQTGTTVHRHLTDLRLRAALPRLRAGNLAALALDLGFSSHSHFSRAFRRRFGAPPSRLG